MVIMYDSSGLIGEYCEGSFCLEGGLYKGKERESGYNRGMTLKSNITASDMTGYKQINQGLVHTYMVILTKFYPSLFSHHRISF